MITTNHTHLGRLRMRCSSDWMQSIKQKIASASAMAEGNKRIMTDSWVAGPNDKASPNPSPPGREARARKRSRSQGSRPELAAECLREQASGP